MNIALMAHDRKKELMVQFCIAYCGILAEHNLCATHVTGKLVAEATGLPITLYLHAEQGGAQQIGARLSCNETDLMLFFRDPAAPVYMMTVWGLRILPLCMPLAIICMHFNCYGQVSGRQLLGDRIGSIRR